MFKALIIAALVFAVLSSALGMRARSSARLTKTETFLARWLPTESRIFGVEMFFIAGTVLALILVKKVALVLIGLAIVAMSLNAMRYRSSVRKGFKFDGATKIFGADLFAQNRWYTPLVRRLNLVGVALGLAIGYFPMHFDEGALIAIFLVYAYWNDFPRMFRQAIDWLQNRRAGKHKSGPVDQSATN